MRINVKAEGPRPKAKRITRAALTLALLSSVGAIPAAAQEPRVFLSVNALYRTPARTLSDNVAFQTPFSAGRETGTASSRYRIPTGPTFDGNGVVRLWRGLGAGVGVSAFSSRNDFSITAEMPHPFFFNQMRTVEGTVNARHAETVVHVMAAYSVPLTPRVTLMLTAGPSRFSVEQKLVRSVTATELYPFDTAQFGTADFDVFNTNAWGFNAGADLSWMFARNVGMGGIVRFAQATVDLTPSGRTAVKMDVGGFQAGGGVRLAF